MPLTIDSNTPLHSLTSWRVGGPAEFLCAPKTESELLEALSFAREKSLRVTLIGGGTNVLVSDLGVQGLVISLGHLKAMSFIESQGRLQITAECGVAKSELLKLFLKFKLSPALFLAGLPGDVGGGVVMNAGVAEKFLPREFVEIVDWVEIISFDGSRRRIAKSDLKWNYRHCDGWQPGVIYRVGISWPMTADSSVLDKVREANRTRLSKQPLDMPSGGSTFRNPVTSVSTESSSEVEKKAASAGQLIEECGLKGFTIGGAEVSKLHANFIVNRGSATASDIDGVIRHVQAEVLRLKNVNLQTEVVYLGDWSQR